MLLTLWSVGIYTNFKYLPNIALHHLLTKRSIKQKLLVGASNLKEHYFHD